VFCVTLIVVTFCPPWTLTVCAAISVTLCWAVPWLRWLVVGLSPRRPGFAPESIHLRFVVDNVVLGHSVLPSQYHSTVSLQTHIMWGMNNMSVSGSSSETWSHSHNNTTVLLCDLKVSTEVCYQFFVLRGWLQRNASAHRLVVRYQHGQTATSIHPVIVVSGPLKVAHTRTTWWRHPVFTAVVLRPPFPE
jgi:hypothetical protein